MSNEDFSDFLASTKRFAALVDDELTPYIDGDSDTTWQDRDGNLRKSAKGEIDAIQPAVTAAVGAAEGYADSAQAAATSAKAEVDAHTSKTDNPHGVTKSQVGLGSVSNDQQLVAAQNLGDLPSAPDARTALGLGPASTRDVGTTAGTLVLYEDIPKPGSASTSSEGLTEYATTAEHQSGAANRSATPAGVNQMGFMKARHAQSGQYAVPTSGIVTWSHGLGDRPDYAWVSLLCVIAEQGYSVGDEVERWGYRYASDNSSKSVPSVIKTNNQIQLAVGDYPPEVITKSSGADADTRGVTRNNWRFVFHAVIYQ